MSIALIDYEAGNLRSVELALKHIGADFFTTSDPDKAFAADKVIFPGVGEASSAMENLVSNRMGEALVSFTRAGKPFLGICLGSQIVLDYSEEGNTECLGILPGRCRRFSSEMGLKVPHMGWNTLEDVSGSLFRGINPDAGFYFVHSYFIEPEDEAMTAAFCDYGIRFVCAMEKDNVFTLQFHPEKSGTQGLLLLRNFRDL